MERMPPRPAGSCARVLLTLVVLFFLFPIFWVVLMSFQTNETDPAHPALAVLRRRPSTTTPR